MKQKTKEPFIENRPFGSNSQRQTYLYCRPNGKPIMP